MVLRNEYALNHDFRNKTTMRRIYDPSEFPEYIDLFASEIPYRAVRQDELMLEGFREGGTLVPSDRALGPGPYRQRPSPAAGILDDPVARNGLAHHGECLQRQFVPCGEVD